MRISDLFKQTTVESKSGSAVRNRAAEQAADKNKAGKDDDTVSISPLARQFAQVSQILNEESESQQARVAELKKQVANGSYSVSSEDTAVSIVSFLRDEER